MSHQANPPLVAHLIHRLDIGGLENGLINLINHMPEERYRHAIICMTEYTDFRQRLNRKDVECYALHKREGHDFLAYGRLWRLLRRMRPAILHTRNLGTLECVLPAALAGVRIRVHGEHGRDMLDIDGTSRKYTLWRKLFRPLVDAYVAVSRDIEHWLYDTVHVAPGKVFQIYNGVDSQRFHPRSRDDAPNPLGNFAPPGTLVIGTVGRMNAEKDTLTLVRAFITLIETDPALKSRARLVLIGDGPLRDHVQSLVDDSGFPELFWLMGPRDDIPELLRSMEIFVLPSLGEGISNTILEAMASGLPVVATHVGGNPELVVDGETGTLVPAADPRAMAAVIRDYLLDTDRMREHGRAGRRTVEHQFTIAGMVERYAHLYDTMTAGRKSDGR